MPTKSTLAALGLSVAGNTLSRGETRLLSWYMTEVPGNCSARLMSNMYKLDHSLTEDEALAFFNDYLCGSKAPKATFWLPRSDNIDYTVKMALRKSKGRRGAGYKGNYGNYDIENWVFFKNSRRPVIMDNMGLENKKKRSSRKTKA